MSNLEVKSFEIKIDQNLGRHFEASRDLDENSLIISEAPIVVGPKWKTPQSEQLQCVGCFQPIQELKFTCKKCDWPACHPDCPFLADPKFHDLECSLLSIRKAPVNSQDIKKYRSDILLVLKCLMLQVKDPKKWNQLMDLEANEKHRKASLNYEEAEKKIKYVEENYLSLIKAKEEESGKLILPMKDQATLHKIYGIIETNAPYIKLPNGVEISGIYPTCSFLEHSCMPNCSFTFDVEDGFKFVVKSGRKLKSGEHISIMYTHTNLLWGTQLRQQRLKKAKYFTCACGRCSDPTELGTYFSALCCAGMSKEKRECEGFLLPDNPLSDKTEWVCNKCPAKETSEQVRLLIAKIGEEVEALLQPNPTPSQLEATIEKLSQSLHPNHYQNFPLKFKLIQLYDAEKINDETLAKKFEICESLLYIVDTLDLHSICEPIYKARILYEKFRGILEFCKRGKVADLAGTFKCLERADDILKSRVDAGLAKDLEEKVAVAMADVKLSFNNKV